MFIIWCCPLLSLKCVCFDCISNRLWNISDSKKNWARCDQNVQMFCVSYRYPLFVSHFKETWIFSTYLKKTLVCQISWKSFQWEPRRTDKKPIVAFRKFFAKAPKISVIRDKRNSNWINLMCGWPCIVIQCG